MNLDAIIHSYVMYKVKPAQVLLFMLEIEASYVVHNYVHVCIYT